MSPYTLSPGALEDVYDIWTYMAQDDLQAADRVEDRLFAAFEALARMPGQGHRRTDLTSEPVLFFPVYSYLIVYRPDKKPLQIVAVLHGARDVKRVLEGRALS